MTKSVHPVLCGGTFFSLIVMSRKPTVSRRQRIKGKSDAFSESDMLLGLLRIIQPDYIRPAGDTFKTYSTNYKKCAEYTPDDLKFDNMTVISAFSKRLNSDYNAVLSAMTVYVNNFIGLGTTAKEDVMLVKRLIELILSDKSIPPTCKFAINKNGSAVAKSELADVTEVYLPAFLLSVWNFIVTDKKRKDNHIGVTTITSWAARGQSKRPDGSSIAQDIKVKCERVYTADSANAEDENNCESVLEFLPDCTEYLNRAYEKYCTIKTLLYNEQPKPFYDFYVCNNIERRIPVPSKFGSQHRIEIIENVTVKKLTEKSRFIIIAGIGGLGKSMMMRHLLLNTINNYAETLTIPVFIPLKDYDETVDTLFDYIFSKVADLSGEITSGQFEEILEKGKYLLLFDGLDEIGSTYASHFERQLESFTDKYPTNNFVISSRPYKNFVSYSRFTELQLKPFTKQQALTLIDNLEFRLDEPIIKQKFRNALDGNLYNTHYAFIQNPLLLIIMLLTFEQYAEVPSKMHLFYREAFSALSVKHDASKGAYKRTLCALR